MFWKSKANRGWGMLLLGVLLILFGVSRFLPALAGFAYFDEILAVMAIAAGVLILLRR
ncbi:MAG: hypothetical protein ACREJB_13160 [Planctomycetaceae bacterium]